MSEPGRYVILALDTPKGWALWGSGGVYMRTMPHGALMTKEFAEQQLKRFHPTRQAVVVEATAGEALVILLNG